MIKDLFVEDKGLEVNTELTLGDKSEQLENRVGDNVNANNIVNNNDISLPFLIMLALGWLLPSPGAMWNGLVSLLPGRGK